LLIGIAAAMFLLLNGRIAVSADLPRLRREQDREDAVAAGGMLPVGASHRSTARRQFHPPAGDRGDIVAAPADRSGAPGWVRHENGQWLHQRARSVRRGAAFAQIAGRDGHIHGVRGNHGFRDASYAGA